MIGLSQNHFISHMEHIYNTLQIGVSKIYNVVENHLENEQHVAGALDQSHTKELQVECELENIIVLKLKLPQKRSSFLKPCNGKTFKRKLGSQSNIESHHPHNHINGETRPQNHFHLSMCKDQELSTLSCLHLVIVQIVILGTRNFAQ